MWDSKIGQKIFKKLKELDIDYLVVGGAALVVHGIPRSTLDIDCYLKTSKENVLKIFELARELKLDSNEKSLVCLSDKSNLLLGQWICFSFEGQDVLDVFFTDEKEFKKLYKSSLVKENEELAVRVVSLDDLIKLKQYAARPIDLADIELIKQYGKSI